MSIKLRSRKPRLRKPRFTKAKKRRFPFARMLFGFLSAIVIGLSCASAMLMFNLKVNDPKTSSFIELNKQKHNRNIRQAWVSMDNISLYLPVAILASEDQQFPNHLGFDLKQIQEAMRHNSEPGNKTRGASTITQQTVKNLFLWPQRSFTRKAVEAWLTLWMEIVLPKKRILELYLNFAQFGKSVFGAEAASRHYFGIPASQLNPEQSALLAATLPTPSRSNPANPSEYLLQRADFIQDQMPRIGGRRLIREL